MRSKNLLLTAAVIGLAVVAGLLGVGGTWALWNASVQSDAGTIQSADFNITVNDTSIPDDGSDVSVEWEDPGAQLTPTTKVYAAITVANATNASGPFDVTARLDVPNARPTESGLEDHLNLHTARKTADTCAESIYSPTTPIGELSVLIEKNASRTFCLEVGLESGAPASLSGTSVAVGLPLYIEQIPAGD